MTRDGERSRSSQVGQKREDVLRAALEAFSDIGYRSTTVSDILRRSALTSGEFYDHFNDKEAAFLGLVGDGAAPLFSRLGKVGKGASSLEELVRGFCREYFSYIVSDGVLSHFMRTNREEMRALIDQPAMRWAIFELEENIRSGTESGRLPAVDAGYLTATIVGVAFEVGLRMLERKDPNVDGAAGFAERMILGGFQSLLAEGGQGPPSSGPSLRSASLVLHSF